jgi:hypothetical protein
MQTDDFGNQWIRNEFKDETISVFLGYWRKFFLGGLYLLLMCLSLVGVKQIEM